MFLNLSMLAGIAGALLPLVIHLLSRSRYRTVDWGAMMFLQGRDGQVSDAARIRQAILLVLRMLIAGGLAIALAQPVVGGRWGGLARNARTIAVIVLDDSASMGTDESGKTRQDLARSAVLSILESLRENRVGVVVMGPRQPEGLDQPTTDLQQVAQRVMSLPEPSGRADVALGLARAADILDRAPELSREIYVVCDRQASTWREAASDGFRQSWAARLTRTGTQTRFFVVPVGSDRSENIAIESVELIHPPAIAHQEAEIEVKVRNYGSGFRAGVELKLASTVGDEKSTPISVGPDSTTSVRVPLRFFSAGSRLVTASLSGSGLKFDDRMQAAVDVIDPVRVLIISGDERGAALQNESDFLRVALAPKAAEARLRGESADKLRGDPCRVEILPFEKWNEDLNLRAYQVIILANVPQFTSGQAAALEPFVYEGGGLWIAPGSLARIENYNALLYGDGNSILPARLQPPTEDDGSEATAIQGISDFDHPIFRFLKGRPDPIPPVTIARYFPAEVRGRHARVLAQYVSGQPFLVEGTIGRGRVVLMTVPADADWSTLPLSNFYLPMAQSIVRHIARSVAGERNLLPGQPIVARFGPDVKVTRADIRLPEAHEGRALEPVPVIGRRPLGEAEVRYPATSVPGHYELRVEGTMPDSARRIHFVVQTPRIESDLTPLTPAQWSDLARRLGFERMEAARDSIVSAINASRGGRELWMSLLVIVIGLCLGESLLARRWSGEDAR